MARCRTDQLVGRTIVAVRWNPTRQDWLGGVTYDPRLILDNGREIYFTVDENDGSYGISIGATLTDRGDKRAAKRKARTNP